MQADGVHTHHWMTNPAFLNVVAIGQATPGPMPGSIGVLLVLVGA